MPVIPATEMSRNTLADLRNAYQRDDIVINPGDKMFRLLGHIAYLEQENARLREWASEGIAGVRQQIDTAIETLEAPGAKDGGAK